MSVSRYSLTNCRSNLPISVHGVAILKCSVDTWKIQKCSQKSPKSKPRKGILDAIREYYRFKNYKPIPAKMKFLIGAQVMHLFFAYEI